MKKGSFKRDLYILLTCFLISRMIIKILGVSFGYSALYEYWQYLDVTSLKTNLLQSLWYQHAQPPVFNFLLGVVLKLSGSYSLYVMESLLMMISAVNAIILLSILRKLVYNSNLPLALSLLYLLSPATMLYENELFYTTFISLLLLTASIFIIKFHQKRSWRNLCGIFMALILLCLTRSSYHLLWLIIISCIMAALYHNRNDFRKVLLTGGLATGIVCGWYVKNYLVFDKFSASSWVGINFSRIVFHDNNIADSTDIASVHPFMPISYYKNFITDDYKKKYAGKNDRVLLMETKNDRFINMNDAGYLQVSTKYMQSALKEVNHHPCLYLQHVITAFTIFFTPASSYFKLTANGDHIRYYDLLYSFNPSHLFHEKINKQRSLVVAAIPKFFLYLLTTISLIKEWRRTRTISFLNIFIITTVLFSLIVSSLLDYGENMRFRFELEPLFLVLAAQAIVLLRKKKILQVDKNLN